MRKTKIVCTIGPATDDDKILREMMLAGMNVARFNFSHGDYDIHKKRFEQVTRLRKELGIPVATMLDTKGRLMGFENMSDEYVVSVENPDNLFYEQIYLAIDRKILSIHALPPREWFVLPHSTEEGSTAVSIPPDASLQLVIKTDVTQKVQVQFRKKDLGI